ncbi:MAG: hypothetical protein RR523_12260 [Cetobacterium sp.]|uniref:hypothetical protein n=1 Tax=Cetobacterium sp. TaxID=2071632 RepID=UPI002FC8F378
MKILNKWIVPNTKDRYELHQVKYNDDKIDFEVWSNISKKHLKDTTSWGKYKGFMRTYALKFETEKDTIQRKVYLKDILMLCEVGY